MMVRLKPALLAVTVLAAGLGGCSNFDLDKLDVFGLNEKKPLPGERKALFPEGVPGVNQGVPPELVKGYQPPTQAVAAPEPAAEKPKPKPRVARRPTRIEVQPEAASQRPQQPAQASTARQPQAPQAPQQQQTGATAPWPTSNAPQQPSPWPDAPAPGTFQR